jgi:hypothetical protein
VRPGEIFQHFLGMKWWTSPESAERALVRLRDLLFSVGVVSRDMRRFYGAACPTTTKFRITICPHLSPATTV